ncbi:hypothetical protein ACFX1X_026018 [Malus domestica]
MLLLISSQYSRSSRIETENNEDFPEIGCFLRETYQREVGREENQNPKEFVEETDIANVPYLQAAVKEVFRLHPAAPVIQRCTNEACEVSEYHIPKHCFALVNVWAIARDPSIWEEPFKYKPERFIGSSIDVKGQDFALLPFGS